LPASNVVTPEGVKVTLCVAGITKSTANVEFNLAIRSSVAVAKDVPSNSTRYIFEPPNGLGDSVDEEAEV
jgi:hypothetical protein